MGLEYKSFIDADKIPEKYMRQLFDLEVEVWGQEPFCEYKICDSESCRRIFSIKEVQNSGGGQQASSGEDFCCVDCSSATSYMYKSEEFYAIMQEYVKNNVSMVLMISEEDKVEGFGILSQGTINGIANYEFQTRPGGLAAIDIASALGEALFNKEYSGGEEIVCFHQIFVSKEVRNAALTYKLMQELFFMTADLYSNLPVVGETLYDGRFYPVSRSMGFQDSVHDKHGYVVQYIEKYSDLLKFLWENEGFQDFQSLMIGFRKQGKKISQEENLGGTRYYKP